MQVFKHEVCYPVQDPIDRHAKERIKELLVRKCAHVVQEHEPELLRLVCVLNVVVHPWSG